MKITFGHPQEKKIKAILNEKPEPPRRILTPQESLKKNGVYYKFFGWDLASYGEVLFEDIDKITALKLQRKLGLKGATIIRSKKYL